MPSPLKICGIPPIPPLTQAVDNTHTHTHTSLSLSLPLFREDLSICFSKVHDSGRVIMQDMEISDAFCLELRQSGGLRAMTDTIKYMRLMGLASERDPRLEGEPVLRELSPRATHISDSGWINFPVGSYWRILNTTFSCTANITHELPSSFDPRSVWSIWTLMALGVGVVVAVVAAIVGAWALQRRAARRAGPSGLAELPEQTVATAHGYSLLRLLGVGHYGRVFLARQTSSGELLAIKVITVYTLRQLEAAYAECRTMLAIRHANCVRVHTYFSARMEHRLRPVSPGTSGENSDYLEQALSLDPLDVAGSAPGSGSSGPRSWSEQTALLQASPVSLGAVLSLSSGSGSGSAAEQSAFALDAAWAQPRHGSGASSSRASSRSSAADDRPASFAMQVHMVVEFCDRGTLENAILTGAFAHPVTGQPRLVRILVFWGGGSGYMWEAVAAMR